MKPSYGSWRLSGFFIVLSILFFNWNLVLESTAFGENRSKTILFVKKFLLWSYDITNYRFCFLVCPLSFAVIDGALVLIPFNNLKYWIKSPLYLLCSILNIYNYRENALHWKSLWLLASVQMVKYQTHDEDVPVKR